MPLEDNTGIKLSLRLDRRIVAAIEKVLGEGHDLNQYLYDIIIAHVINAGLLDPAVGKEFELRASLLDRVHQIALSVFSAQGFSHDFTKRAILACESDAQWLADYAVFVGDDPYKTGNQRKYAINRAIGATVLAAIGGKVERSSNGKPILVPVKGSIIQKYTKMKSCTLAAETAVEPETADEPTTPVER